MAVATKHNEFHDNITRRNIVVHSISVNNSNKKGAAAAIGGELVTNPDGSWHIVLNTKVNGRKTKYLVFAGQIVFRTGTSNRWQVLGKQGFNKRFIVK